MHTILLYYKYTDIADPQALAYGQRSLCEKLKLKGRVIIAHEGVNATVEGTIEAIEQYIAEMKRDSRFADVHWKKSAGSIDGQSFPKLSIKVRKEIVSLHLDDFDPATGDINPAQLTGKRLSPEELRQWFAEGREFEIVDMRNDYEHASGHFKGSVLPPLKNFRDLAKVLPQLQPLKNKTVLSVCTGGVRCEKASAYLVKQGFQDVYQLDGGIVSYMEKYPGQDFAGALYVFDGRVTMHFDKAEEHKVIGRCGRCERASEHYVNCKNLSCHYHFICCTDCVDEKGEAYCSDCVSKFSDVPAVVSVTGH